MTDQTADQVAEAGAGQAGERRAARRSAPIVPAGNIAGRALVLVIAIMTFLSCLTFGAVTLVRDTASVWENQISREATMQIKPADGVDKEAALAAAAEIAAAFPGVKGAKIVDRAATARLLEPWLGPGLDIEQLPVPRLVVVTRGGEGSAWYSNDGRQDMPSVKPAAFVDSTGAGDSFVAGTRKGLIAGQSNETAARIGATVASFVIEKWGCQTNLPSLAQVAERFEANFGRKLSL